MTSVAGVDYLFFKGHRGTRAIVVANVPATRARELAERYRERGWEMIVVGRFAVMGDGIAVEVVTDQQTPWVRISEQIVHPFRFKSSTRSGPNRPVIPEEIVHFRRPSGTSGKRQAE